MKRKITSSWRVATVEELASKSPRAIAIGPFGSSLRSDNYVPHGFPVIRGQNIGSGRALNLSDLVYVPEELASRLSGSTVRQGDLVFPHRGAIGRVGLITSGEYLLSSSMMKLTCDPAQANPMYLFYYFRGPGKHELLSRASTVGTPGIGQPLRSLRGIVVSLPNLGTQQSIAGLLGALDDKIAGNAELARTADRLSSARTASRVQDVPAAPLAEIADVTMGSSPPGSSYNEVGDGLPFYQGVRDFGLRSPSARISTTQPLRFADRGDSLVSVRAPVGRVNVADRRCCIGRGLASVRTRTATPHLLPYLLRHGSVMWETYEGGGTVFGSINRAQLESIEVPLLPRGVSIELEATISRLDDLVVSLLAENESLAKLRDTMLPHLMSGRLPVRDAERTVSDAV